MDDLGSQLKAIRLKTGMSLRELARQIDVSPSFISQIENGKSQPSVSTLYALAKLLNVSVDDLFDDKRAAAAATATVTAPAVQHQADAVAVDRGDMSHPSTAWQPSEYSNRISIVHPSHRPRIEMAAGVTWERLAATPERAVNFMKIVYTPGAASTGDGEMVHHEGYEYGYVVEGELEVTIGDEVFKLHAGESLGFDSSIPHIFRNTGHTDMHGVWFVHGTCAQSA